jgi:UDP-2,3-diacylglucosamine pyrophosphatase LpxH
VTEQRLFNRRLPNSETPRAARATSSPAPEARHYRSIWISDFHLGTARCKADALLEFLRTHTAENLFLVGDVIDGWNLGPGWCWNAAQTAVVEEIWAWRRRGARLVFLPGNHDEANGSLIRTLFGDVRCEEELVHRTAEGRRMLIIHGHQFDRSIHPNRWLSIMGSMSYSAALRFNLWYNRERIGRRPRPRATNLRRSIRKAVHYLVDFDDRCVVDAARRRRADGVICGHTHRPDYRSVGPILYVNDGDWVQSRTALVEEPDGTLRLLGWNAEGGAVEVFT